MILVAATDAYRPEYDRMVQTIGSLGLVSPLWTAPAFEVRRSPGRSPDGLAEPERIVVILHPRTWSLGAIHQTIAHELAHVLTWDEPEHHGPRFRAVLRQIVEAHWPAIVDVHLPNIEKWRRADNYAFEDAWMTLAIDKIYEGRNQLL